MSETILEVRAARGQHVDKGDVLVRLDATLAGADLAHAEARQAGARAALLIASHDLERFAGLRRSRIASAQDLERAQLAHDDAAARVREAGARIAAAEKRIADLTIVAPVGGVVDQIPFDPGERVPAGGVVIVLLKDAAPWVRVWVPERSAARVQAGTPARIRIDGIPGALRGSVLDVARESEFTPHFALTERDRVHLVYETRVAVVDAPPAIRPGLPAEVTILTDTAPGEPAP